MEVNRMSQENQRLENKRAQQENKDMLKEFIGILPHLVSQVMKGEKVVKSADQAEGSGDDVRELDGSASLARCTRTFGSMDVERTPSSAPNPTDTVPSNQETASVFMDVDEAQLPYWS
jgi:hypothetical protein